MTPLRCLVLLAVLCAAVGGWWLLTRKGGPPGEASQPGQPGTGKGATVPGDTAGTDANPRHGPGDSKKVPPDPASPDPPRNLTREAQSRTLQRMEKLGQEWLDGWAGGAALSASQKDGIREIVNRLAAGYEALRWVRDVEQDKETVIEKMYEKAEADIRALLGAGQQDLLPALPRDWGFGALDPGPLKNQ